MPATAKHKKKQKGGKSKKRSAPPIAETVDRHALYQESVQDVESEVDFVDQTFQRLRGRKAVSLREDFCGTAATTCEWVKRRVENRGVAIDNDAEVLNWGREHNLAALPEDSQKRVTLMEGDVLEANTEPVDALLAMNFSYWLFQERKTLLAYFKCAKKSLKPDGIFFLDCYGGWDAHRPISEEREVEGAIGEYDYIWDQDEFDPINHRMRCYIHFKFADGSRMKRAFSYEWRLWSLPEIRDLLEEAGFAKIRVFWEGADDDTLEGNGEFEEVETAESDPGWICYIVAEKSA